MTSALVQFGRLGFIGRFTATAGVARGERVIVRGPRGVEMGTVLCNPDEPFETTLPPEGELVRAATAEDDAHAASLSGRSAELLGQAVAAAGERGLPLTFVDAELTFDDHFILHGLAWAACDATPLFEDLSEQFGLTVRLLDLSRAPTTRDPKPSGGCGEPGCGSGEGGCSTGGGGCSSGGCSRGSVKSGDELSAYFANLRRQMEAAGATRTPLA
jgi:cell fate regulator YaaT (PSP1 superfamily)